MKCGLKLQSIFFFCYSGKVRIEEKVFHTILFKDLQQRGVHCSTESLDWNPGLLGDFGRDSEQSQLPLHGKDTVLASFMEHSQIH